MLKNEKGMGVAITLMALILISLLGTAIVIRSISLAQVVNQKNYSITAVEAAKAGIACGIYEVESDIYYDDDIPVACVADYTGVTNTSEKGYYEVFVTNNLTGSLPLTSPKTGYDIPAGCVELLSLGYAGNPSATEAKKKMRVIAIGHKLVNVTFPMNYAVYGKGVVDGSGGSPGAPLTDSYDSDVAPYDRHNPGQNGDVGSNNDVISDHKIVHGDVHALSPGNNQVDDYTGSFNQLSSPMDMPRPVLPTGVAYDGRDLTIKNTTVTLPPAEYGVLDVQGNNNTNLILTSGKYIINSITVSGNGKITVQPSDIDGDSKVDPVQIWVLENMDIGGNGFVNSGADPKPTQLLIYGMGTDEAADADSRGEEILEEDRYQWNIHGNGLFYGAVYAPYNDISVRGAGANGDVYGAIVGYDVTFNGTDTHVHYDEALSRLGGGEVYLGMDKDNISWVIELQ